MKLTNFFSNLWIITNIENEDIDPQVLLSFISNIKNEHRIKKIINFDKEFKFWKDTITTQFNNTITTQIIIDNQNKCLALYKKYSKLIINSILEQQHILLFTSKKNECMIGFLIYFICKHGNVNLDKAMNTINSKIGYLEGYKLDTNIKKILIQECYNK